MQRAVQGSVVGTAVRDFCDEPEEGLAEVGADWPGTTQCDGPDGVARAAVRSLAEARASAHHAHASGPDVRQPAASRASSSSATTSSPRRSRRSHRPTISRAPGGRTVLDADRDAAPDRRGSPYEATRTCSQFPHVYDGIVYLYDCEDTLAWNGTLTLTPSR